MNYYRSSIIWMVAIAVLLPTSCWAQDTSQSSVPIRIGSFSKAIDYAPYHIARGMGWFEEVAKRHGTTVTYTEFQSLAPINEAFATDRVDMVFEAEPPAIIGRAAGIDVRVMGVGASLNQEILVRKELGIDKIEGLRRRKIAVLAGTSSHFGLLKILEEHGLGKTDVQIVDMIPPNAQAAFESGQIDGWAVWPPFVEQQVVSGRGVVLQGGDAFIQSIVAMRGKFCDKKPQLTKELLEVVRRAQQWIASNENKAQVMIANDLSLALAVVKKAWPKHNFAATIDKKELADIQSKADFLFESRLVKQRVLVNELVQVEERN